MASATLGLIASGAWAVCDTSVCTISGTTCTISASHTIDDGCVLPLNDYDVAVTKPAVLTTAASGDNWTLSAKSLSVLGTLRAPEGTLTIQATQGVTTDKTSNAPGKLEATGGTIAVTAGGAVTLNGTLVAANGGAEGDGGRIGITAQTISGSSALEAKGAGGDGGHIDLLTSETVTLTEDVSLTGEITVDAAGSGGPWEGGSIRIDAGDALSIWNDLLARGASNGPGGSIWVEAGTTAGLYGNLNASGVGTGGDGGRIEVRAASVTIGSTSGTWTLTGGSGAHGGEAVVEGRTGTVFLSGAAAINASGGSNGGEGGSVDLRAPGNVTLGGDITANASGTASSGGTIIASSHATLSVSGTLEARSTANDGTRNGLIRLYGCTVTVNGNLKTRNPAGGGGNVIRYATAFNGSGTLLADDDANGLEGNVVECHCVDANSDGACDAPAACAVAPSTGSMTLTPALRTYPAPNSCS